MSLQNKARGSTRAVQGETTEETIEVEVHNDEPGANAFSSTYTSLLLAIQYGFLSL